ncbi:MAG: hypothetical protein ACI89L_001767 [Phycisphaerales bacterium]|jgi:hypothetical protein
MPELNFNLNGLRMNATTTAPGGVIDSDTVFTFTQDGPHAEAHYAGGRVLSGHLIGTITRDRFEFRYCQRHATPDGSGQELAGGHSRCTLERDDLGKLRILERFTWADGGTGENIIAEL